MRLVWAGFVLPHSRALVNAEWVGQIFCMVTLGFPASPVIARDLKLVFFTGSTSSTTATATTAQSWQHQYHHSTTTTATVTMMSDNWGLETHNASRAIGMFFLLLFFGLLNDFLPLGYVYGNRTTMTTNAHQLFLLLESCHRSVRLP